EQEITVLFADIRGFTRRCSQETPERVRMLLNRYFALAVGAVKDRAGKGGYVSKFLGDGVMALFGAITPRSDHADLAVASALEMLRRLNAFNAELEAAGQAPLNVGVGIHSGPALVGCFGAQTRKELTAIGETVNLAQRLEQLSKTAGGPILISQRTHDNM